MTTINGLIWTLSTFVLLGTLAVTVSAAPTNYTIGKCYCFPDPLWANVSLKMNTFPKKPTPPPYQYVGIMPMSMIQYSPCFCSDVTRVKVYMYVTAPWDIAIASGSLSTVAAVSTTTTASPSTSTASPTTTTTGGSTATTVSGANSTTSASTTTTPTTTIISSSFGSPPTTIGIPYLNTNISWALNNLTAQLNTYSAIKGRIVSLGGFFQSFDSSAVKYLVEIVCMGQDATMQGLVSAPFAAVTNNTSLLPGVGSIQMPSPTYWIDSCAAPPQQIANASYSGTATMEGTILTYTCSTPGYIFSNSSASLISQCQYNSLIWSPINASLICVPGCNLPPPKPPASSSTWNNKTQLQGTTINYTCVAQYWSHLEPMAYTVCQNGNWTPISTEYLCMQWTCNAMPPQVPDYGLMTWTGGNIYGSTIQYNCANGYVSSTGKTTSTTCINGTWIGFQTGWICCSFPPGCPVAAASGPTGVPINYIFAITLPAVIGLVILVMICLCCTRGESCIFRFCNEAPKGQGYKKAP